MLYFRENSIWPRHFGVVCFDSAELWCMSRYHQGRWLSNERNPVADRSRSGVVEPRKSFGRIAVPCVLYVLNYTITATLSSFWSERATRLPDTWLLARSRKKKWRFCIIVSIEIEEHWTMLIFASTNCRSGQCNNSQTRLRQRFLICAQIYKEFNKEWTNEHKCSIVRLFGWMRKCPVSIMCLLLGHSNGSFEHMLAMVFQYFFWTYFHRVYNEFTMRLDNFIMYPKDFTEKTMEN